jgi:hypothetical protein
MQLCNGACTAAQSCTLPLIRMQAQLCYHVLLRHTYAHVQIIVDRWTTRMSKSSFMPQTRCSLGVDRTNAHASASHLDVIVVFAVYKARDDFTTRWLTTIYYERAKVGIKCRMWSVPCGAAVVLVEAAPVAEDDAGPHRVRNPAPRCSNSTGFALRRLRMMSQHYRRRAIFFALVLMQQH